MKCATSLGGSGCSSDRSRERKLADLWRGADGTLRTLGTGGAGFLGSHLCDRLLSDGHEVIALDNLFTGSKHNIEQLLGRSGFEFIRHDVVNPILLEVDWVFNLACPPSPLHYQFNPVKTVKTSVV